MKKAGAVNVNYFQQMVEDLNGSKLSQDLGLLKIQLGPELKDATLKVFTELVESIPVERETEIPQKAVEMYNFVVDDEYQIPEGIFEEEKVEEQVDASAVDPGADVTSPVEKPVKEKKVKEKVFRPASEKKKFLSDMIQEGTHTRKEIGEAYVEKFGGNIATPLTALTDGKNPKYNRFEKPVVENNKILSFGE